MAGFIVRPYSDDALKRERLILGERAKFNAEMARFAPSLRLPLRILLNGRGETGGAALRREETHLARARWTAEHDYPQLLQGDAPH